MPGKASLYHHLGADGPDGVVPDVEPARVHYGAFRSSARGRRVGWAVATPGGTGTGLPVLVVLHGRGQDHTAVFRRSRLALDRFLTDAVRRGVPPFAIASVDGGETYWHDRASGDRAETMVVEESAAAAGAAGPRHHPAGAHGLVDGRLRRAAPGGRARRRPGAGGRGDVARPVALLRRHGARRLRRRRRLPPYHRAGPPGRAGGDRGAGRLRQGRPVLRDHPGLRGGLRAPAGGRVRAG
ncbi:hypothetical protein [Nocardioides convexus]|uniref:hypothetical protein n=1 Tax=Nocardioides convexus TaxID=2712224 RepID=UPI002418902F|nr:hypothetical protein [Nocardioides convexus]